MKMNTRRSSFAKPKAADQNNDSCKTLSSGECCGKGTAANLTDLKPKRRLARRRHGKNIFNARELQSVRYNMEKRVCEFYLVWEPTKESGGNISTSWEPFENMLDPTLFLNFECRLHSLFTLENGSEDARWKFPMDSVAGAGSAPAALRIDEFIMTGAEKLKRIISEEIRTLKTGEIQIYYCVRFHMDVVPRLVQRAFLEYYFPTKLRLFLMKG